MGLRKDKSLIDQATDYVEGVIPQLEAAVLSARDKAAPVIADARDKTAPVIADARDKVAPVIADARAKAAPVLADGAAYAADKAAVGAALAAAKAAEASELVAAKAAEVKAEDEPKGGGKFKKLLLLGGLLAIGGVIFKRLKGDSTSDNWQSSYTPTPAPAPATTTGSAGTAEDTAGSSPDEALSDAADEPRPPSTPDDPAEVVTVDPEAEAAAEAKNGSGKG